MGGNRKPGVLQVVEKMAIVVVVVVVMSFDVISLAGVYFDQKNSIRQNQKQERVSLKSLIRDSGNPAGRGK